MWTPATRRQHSRAGLRYETDLTDAEWRLIAPLLPAPKRTGRPLSWPLREIVNAIFYVMRGGVAWRLLPSDLPPKSTAYRWFAAWRDGGVFEALNHALLMIDRERSGRPASPSACIIDVVSDDATRWFLLLLRSRVPVVASSSNTPSSWSSPPMLDTI